LVEGGELTADVARARALVTDARRRVGAASVSVGVGAARR
jgi:hypothetical protein